MTGGMKEVPMVMVTELNEAGKELLSFLSTNQASVCNTWFDIHKQTWQHLKSCRWHCIDYVIMRKRNRRKCLDVSVMRGADCNTDHRMLRAKIVVGGKKLFRRRVVAVRRLDVAKLKVDVSMKVEERRPWVVL